VINVVGRGSIVSRSVDGGTYVQVGISQLIAYYNQINLPGKMMLAVMLCDALKIH
jgi:hypothetical protein